jgi:GDP-L-fucose synthase
MSVQRVLILGSAGVIGGEINKVFSAGKYTVLSLNHRELDVLNYGEMVNRFKEFTPDLIVNCVGKVGGIQKNLESPADLLLANANLGLGIVNAALACNVRHLVQFAPACMYPSSLERDYSEEDLGSGPIEPSSSSYGYSKLFLTQAFQSIRKQYGLSWTTLIPSNVFGVNDWRHGEDGHAVSMISRRLLQSNADSIQIWGDGTATRDFISAEQLAIATKFIVDNDLFEKSQVNVSSGQILSIRDLTEKLRAYTGFRGGIIFEKSKPSGAKRKSLNSDWLRSRGWKPTKTIDQSLEEYVEQFKDNLQQR